MIIDNPIWVETVMTRWSAGRAQKDWNNISLGKSRTVTMRVPVRQDGEVCRHASSRSS
jgi:hypothetical protein